MQVYRPFVPNYPPPLLPTREVIINEGLNALRQSTTDQQWLTVWLARRRRSATNPLTLSEYRTKLIHHAQLLRRFKQASSDSDERMLPELKSQIEQSSGFIYEADRVQEIHKQIQRRKSKRARLRRQKSKALPDAPADPADAQATKEKPVEEKIQEINSLLQTIDQLKQLKSAHQQQHDSTVDELNGIRNDCTAKLLEYQSELESKSRCSDIDLCNSLFNNHDRSFYESLNPDAQDFLRAHRNVNDLVEVRQAWDQYATTHFSSVENTIPCKWHEPQTPSDGQWVAYIFDNKASDGRSS